MTPACARITRIAARGDGVADDGRHVPLAAPGDSITEDGAVLPGPHHARPACPHYPACGGCQLQHVDDAAYADYCVGRIVDALAAHGLTDIPVAPPHLSPPRSRRRATVQAVREGKTVRLGFATRGTHAIVDVRECAVVRPAIAALFDPLRLLIGRLGVRSARIAVTIAREGADMVIAGVDGDRHAGALIAFAAEHGLARVSTDDGQGPCPLVQHAAPTVMLAGVAVRLPPNAFLQATADGEAALTSAVRDGVGAATRSLDLFAGLGTFALALDGQVTAVEGARDAIGALAETGAVRTIHRDLFRSPLSTAELAGFDAVVLDPPRAGAKEQVVTLAASAVPRIVYVSCNPATFARDAAVLVGGGYRLERVTPVGQFRWSAHVELVGVFAR